MSRSYRGRITESNINSELQGIMARAKGSCSLTDMIMVVLAGLRVLGQMIVQMVLEERDEGMHRERKGPPQCPQCGKKLRKPRKKEIERMTLLGHLRYMRIQWLCPKCKRGHAPLDATLGLDPLHKGNSLEFVKELVMFCTLHAFDQGCKLMERCFGCSVSTHRAYDLVMGIGDALFKQEMSRANELWDIRHKQPEMFEPTPAALRKQQRARRIYVMMDNSKVRIQEGKRGRGAEKRTKQNGIRERFNVSVHGPVLVKETEDDKAARGASDFRDVRALLIYQEDDIATLSKKRRAILRRRVLAHVGTMEEWLKLLHMAFHEEGVYRAHEVVVVADGGKGIWESVDELLPSTSMRKVVQILDWCHAVSHLWNVAKKWKKGHGKEQVKARARWVDGLVKYLAEGQVGNVLQRLIRLRNGKTGGLAEEIDKCIKYFKDHRQRMSYRQFRNAGMTIGSGAIESVHKWVVQMRCCQAGMAWSEAGINAMLRLRCAWASDRWDDVFKVDAVSDMKYAKDYTRPLAA